MLHLQLGTLGMASLFLAVALALYATIVGALGASRRDARLQTSARLAALATFLVVATAVAVMEAALITNDFSVQYVAANSRIASPLWVKIATLWAALEGSILLWGFLLTAYTALLAFTAPLSPLRPWALAILSGVQVFFLGVAAFIVNPFHTLANPPLDGPGPNALLQNHWMMAVHPVLMYLGFVGLTVPFAYAMAALITRRPGSEWMVQTRRWALTGWGFLGAAIVAGGWWSYDVLGWGGYWAWDPVENVSFMPWLTATAFIHGVQVQERRRMLKSWNVMLIALTFCLSILGTFLTRSGVISSVHAFASGPVGPAFLAFFVLVTLFAFGLIALRWDQVRDRAELDAVVSREGGFLTANILFLAIAFAVLLGTLFPLLVEAVSGQRVTVGPPFFDQVTLPLWMLVFLLMGIGPLLPWRKAEGASLKRNLLWLAGGFVVAGGLALALGMREIYPTLTVALAGYNLVSLGLLLGQVLVPRLRLSTRGAWSVLWGYAHESRRRVGSMIAHLAIVIIALGIAFSSGYRVDQQVRIDFGKSAAFQGYTLTPVDRFMDRSASRISSGAVVDVSKGGRQVATLRPRINIFGSSQEPVSKPAVMTTFSHDLYLNLDNTIGPTTSYVVLRMVYSPLVSWIWFGGLLFAFGVLMSLMPARRQLAERRLELAGEASGEEHAQA